MITEHVWYIMKLFLLLEKDILVVMANNDKFLWKEVKKLKARLFLDDDKTYKILCEDGTIALATEKNLSLFLRNFKFISSLTGEEGNWNTEAPTMLAYKPECDTCAYVQSNDILVVENFNPFAILFEKPQISLDDFIGVNEYAKEVGKSIEQVKVFLRHGRIPNAKKIGRDWIIARSSIHKYPQDQRISKGKFKKREKI